MENRAAHPPPRIPRSTPRDSGNPRHINPASYAGYFLAPKQRLLENSRLLLILCKTDTFSACVRSDYLYRESNKRTKAKHFLLPLPISQGIAPGTRLKRGPLLGVRWRETRSCRRITENFKSLSEQKHPRRGRAGLKFFTRKKTWDLDFPAWAGGAAQLKSEFCFLPSIT